MQVNILGGLVRGAGRWVRMQGVVWFCWMLTACGGGDGAPKIVEPTALLKGARELNLAETVTGVYWNPMQPGWGAFLEVQGDQAIVTLFMYEASGRPTWYSAVAKIEQVESGVQYRFSSRLRRFSGGQSADSPNARTPVVRDVGTLDASFSVYGSLDVRVNGGSQQRLMRYVRSSLNYGVADTKPSAVEAGIYWNPDQSGRGYVMEVIHGRLSVGIFHYDHDGEPTWHLLSSPIDSTGVSAGDFVQTFGGPYFKGSMPADVAELEVRSPVSGSATGRFETTVSAQSPCSVGVRFPGMDIVHVERFRFSADMPCRALVSGRFAPDYGTGQSIYSIGLGADWSGRPATALEPSEIKPSLSNALNTSLAGATTFFREARFLLLQGALPEGMVLDEVTGAIRGVPLVLDGFYPLRIGVWVPGYAGLIPIDWTLSVRLKNNPEVVWPDRPPAVVQGASLPAGLRVHETVPDGVERTYELRYALGDAAATLSVDPVTGVVSGRFDAIGEHEVILMSRKKFRGQTYANSALPLKILVVDEVRGEFLRWGSYEQHARGAICISTEEMRRSSTVRLMPARYKAPIDASGWASFAGGSIEAAGISRFSASLPFGLTMDSATGVITGPPGTGSCGEAAPVVVSYEVASPGGQVRRKAVLTLRR